MNKIELMLENTKLMVEIDSVKRENAKLKLQIKIGNYLREMRNEVENPSEKQLMAEIIFKERGII